MLIQDAHPFANHTVDVELPFTVAQPKITVKSIIDDFRSQLPSNFEGLFEAFVFLSPKKVRVTCRNNRALEDVCNLGLTYRNSLVTFRPCRPAKWVNITRLSYGVPNEAITDALTPYSKVLSIKMDAYKGVYIGVKNVLIEITTPIPSSIRIAEHWCNAFYPGQTPTCFACRQTGHTRANCLDIQPPRIPAVKTAASDDLPRQQDAPGASHEGSQILGSSVKDTPSLSTSTTPGTYASATKAVPPTQPTSVVPTDPVSVHVQAMDEEQEIEVDLSDTEDSDASDEGDEEVIHSGLDGAAARTDAARCGMSAVVATDQPPPPPQRTVISLRSLRLTNLLLLRRQPLMRTMIMIMILMRKLGTLMAKMMMMMMTLIMMMIMMARLMLTMVMTMIMATALTPLPTVRITRRE